MADISGLGFTSTAGMNPGMSEVSSSAPYGSTAGAGGDLTGGGIGSFFQQNPNLMGQLGAAGAGGLAMLLAKPGQLPYLPELQGVASKASGLGDNAARMLAESQTLINPLTTGVLPPGVEAKMLQLKQKQTAATKGTYARLGQTGSTMERDALNKIETDAQAMAFDEAKAMATIGVQYSGQAMHAWTQELQIEGTIYQNLMNAKMKQDSAMASSIGNFASAIGKVAGTVGGSMIGGPIGGAVGGAAGGAVGSMFS